MKWYRSFVEEEDSVFMGDLLSRFGSKGYFFWKRLKALMAEKFDVLNPACNEFNRQWFDLQFIAVVKDPRSIKKYLDFLQDQEKIFYVFKKPMIILYYPELEDLCDKYTLEVIKTLAKEDKIEIGVRSKNLHTFCKNHADSIRKNHHENADKSLEDKEVKPFLLATKRPDGLGSSSNSKRDNKHYTDKQTVMREGEVEQKRIGGKVFQPSKKKTKAIPAAKKERIPKDIFFSLYKEALQKDDQKQILDLETEGRKRRLLSEMREVRQDLLSARAN